MTTLRFHTWVHDNLFDRDHIKYKLRPDTFGEFEKFENVLRYSSSPHNTLEIFYKNVIRMIII